MSNINQAIVQALRETRNCGDPISAIRARGAGGGA